LPFNDHPNNLGRRFCEQAREELGGLVFGA
jgi:hypothetical protein